MSLEEPRAYRKKLVTSGLIFINGEEREVSVNNISMTGVLLQLNTSNELIDIFNNSLISKVIDFYLPQLRLAGTAEIVRVHKENSGQTSLALKYKDITYNIDNLLYKRKVYRKNLSIQGHILLNNDYYDFQTINVSVEGLMIRLTEMIAIAEGLITNIEFKKLKLKGEVQVVWVDFDKNDKTLIGLKYINMNSDILEKNIPRFCTK